MNFADLSEPIRQKALDHSVVRGMRRTPRVFSDTHDFTAIDYGDIILADDRYFLVIAYTREGRFGVDDQPKQWVPKVSDLISGETHILKLVFHEKFEVTLGDFTIPCYRNPEKEARVLELVAGDFRFMQGYAVEDEAGNLIRILDLIRGWRLDKFIHRFDMGHEEYFETVVPGLLAEFLNSIEAIVMVHANGMRHGDIRRDHLYVEYDTKKFRWIDFDYDFYLPERPFALDIYELGSILMYIVGRGNYFPQNILTNPDLGAKKVNLLADRDFSLLSANRVVNLRLLYPYIPSKLNDIFMHFSKETPVFYDSALELVDDLGTFL